LFAVFAITIPREEVTKDDDVGAKVAPEREVTKGRQLALKWLTRAWCETTKWANTDLEVETVVVAICVPSALPLAFTVFSDVDKGAIVKQRTVPSCLRDKLSGSLDRPAILAWKHDFAELPKTLPVQVSYL
jgi:hypothetical protein